MKTDDIYREHYNSGDELVPDFVYDSMGIESLNDEIGHGDLIEHKFPMLSLPTHFFDIDELSLNQLNAIGLTDASTYTVSYKVDGISISMPMEHGKINRMVSRGKRFSGYVLHRSFMELIPESPIIPHENLVDFRAELVMSNKNFEEINESMFNGKYASPRSLVSALANMNQPPIEAVLQCKLLYHGIQGLSGNHFHELSLYIDDTSDIVPYETVGIDELISTVKRMYKEMQSFEFPCDGIVIQHLISDAHNGSEHLDRIAIKEFDEAKYSGKTSISKIEWRLANNGSYFPRIHFVPVMINGSKVEHTAGYCYDYLIRMGLSVGTELIVTMHGGVIPYISNVITPGLGDLQIPEDADEIIDGDVHIWSTNSEDAIRRLRFVRGLAMLDLKDCGISLFNELYDNGIHSLIELGKLIKSKELEFTISDIAKRSFYFELVKRGFRDIKTVRNFSDQLYDRITTFNYVWLIMALRIPGIGFKAANIAGLTLSGYHVSAEYSRGSGKTVIQKFLLDNELINDIKYIANPVAIEHAQGTIEHSKHSMNVNDNRLVACLSKKPTNGMTKQDFINSFLSEYRITENIKEANLLICPEGEQSNKIDYAKSHNIEIRSYNQFIK